jgi:hypothetical protein
MTGSRAAPGLRANTAAHLHAKAFAFPLVVLPPTRDRVREICEQARLSFKRGTAIVASLRTKRADGAAVSEQLHRSCASGNH